MSTEQSDRDKYLSAVAAAAKSNSRIKVGDVGYTFRKEFDAGWFRGVVVKIRPGAEGGLDRRCYFEDGDSEDLSLSQLRNLALLDPEVAKKDANASAAVGAKSVDVFDFEDDEQRTVLHCGVGNEKSKTNVKGMPERITRNAAQIVSKMKNCRNHQYNTISHNNNHRRGFESARITFSKPEDAYKYAANLNDGAMGEAREIRLRTSHRQPKPLRRVDEIHSYEHVKLHCKQKKRAFAEMTSHYDIPVDKAASSTLISSPLVQRRSNKKGGADDPKDNGEDWLEKVAASLGADSSSLRHKRHARSAGRACETTTPRRNRAGTPSYSHASSSLSSNSIVDNFLGRNDNHSLKPRASEFSLPLLSECPVRSWYGCLVFHKNDGRRRVGEVIIEQDKQWVEVVMDGALKKYHVKHLFVVPSDKFKVGDLVPSDLGAPSQSGTMSSELCNNQLIFWLCEKCNACNDGYHLACLSCGTMKPGSPERSIFLGVAREAMIRKDSHFSRRESTRLDMLNQPLSKTQIGMHSKQTCRGKIATISEVLPRFLRNVHQYQVNELSWTIRNIEDSVLCGERTPFPLGMIYRKFFPGYGFHDGRIIKVVRKLLVDNDRNEERHVLVYRCKYNDEDEEDFLHHEIASLCQLYDKRYVSPEAPPMDQIPPGEVFETLHGHTIEIVRHETPSGSRKGEGGTVVVKFHASVKEKEWNLVDLQMAILRKVERPLGGNERIMDDSLSRQSSSADEINAEIWSLGSSPILEWPRRCQKEDHEHDITKGLKLHRKRCNAFLDDDDIAKFPTTSDLNNPYDVRSGVSVGMWDPAGCSGHLSWDPFDSTVCQICSTDKDDNQVVICDNCHNGFHMYCLRPVMVNIPKEDWFCSACSSKSSTRLSFEEFRASITDQEVFRFLGLPYKTARKFFRIHPDAINVSALNSPSAVKQYAKRKLVPAVDVVFGVQNIKFNRSVEKNDWCLPLPLTCEQDYMLSLLSIVAAMKYCSMQSNLDDLVYEGSAKANMNDPSIEVNEISPMSKRNLEIFRAFEHNIRQGVFPPIQVVHDEDFGFSVKALACMQRHTLIAQYLGEVVTLEQSSQSSSDSLMVLLDSGDPSTSLIIDPSRVGNFARFLSGINNRKVESKRKINVRTLRFVMDGKLRVCLFTSRRVEAGEVLNYDYNAGHKGKDILQWMRLGFYDTSNFF